MLQLEHKKQFESLGVHAVFIKKPEQLKEIDGLIIPGGESTAIGKLMKRYGFIEPIQEFASSRKTDIWNMCRYGIIGKGYW